MRPVRLVLALVTVMLMAGVARAQTYEELSSLEREAADRALADRKLEPDLHPEGKTIGTAGAVGAIVGGIIGGVKGAIIGATIGAGGVIAATEGKDVELPAGTIVRTRLDTPLDLRR